MRQGVVFMCIGRLKMEHYEVTTTEQFCHLTDSPAFERYPHFEDILRTGALKVPGTSDPVDQGRIFYCQDALPKDIDPQYVYAVDFGDIIILHYPGRGLPPLQSSYRLAERITGVINANLNADCVVAEVGCGSGVMTAKVLRSCTKPCTLLVGDIEPTQVEHTKQTLLINGLPQDRVVFKVGDKLNEFRDYKGMIDLLYSNGPYFDDGEVAMNPIQAPKTSLYGGSDGLDFYRSLIRQYKNYSKKPGSWLALQMPVNPEIGMGLMHAISTILKDRVEVIRFAAREPNAALEWTPLWNQSASLPRSRKQIARLLEQEPLTHRPNQVARALLHRRKPDKVLGVLAYCNTDNNLVDPMLGLWEPRKR